MNRARPMLHALLVTLPLALCAHSGCTGGRPYGDPGGQPVSFSVDLSREFVRDISHQGPDDGYTQVYVGFSGYGYGPYWGPPGWYGPWHRPWGPWYGPDPFFASSAWVDSPPRTVVYLLGGDGPGEANLFRQELDWGRNGFQVPIRPGRTVALTVQANGARMGWENIGQFVAVPQPGQVVEVNLLNDGPKLTTHLPPGVVGSGVPAPTIANPTPPAAPPAAPTPAPVPTGAEPSPAK